MRICWVGLVVLVGSCTKPNPLDCSDGLCSDPTHPFCDVDGSIGGVVNTCVAVACTPGESTTCRGDVALVCSATGTNYDLVSCERGCNPGVGCVQCLTNDECANPTPICDSDGASCRGCKTDDECPSKVCEAGSCSAESSLLYASANGSDSSACTLADPCTAGRALTLAGNAATPPVIRMLPGTYLVGLIINGVSSAPFRIVATGATIAAQTSILVEDGASLEIRGVEATASMQVVYCTSSTQTRSKLTIRDSKLVVGASTQNLVDAGNCELTLSGVDLDVAASNASGLIAETNSSVIVDRAYIHGTTNAFSLGVFGSRASLIVTTSVLENAFGLWLPSDTTTPGSYVAMAFNTIHTDSGGWNCRAMSNTFWKASYENNIFVGTNAASAIEGTNCTLTSNVLFPFTGSPGTNVTVDPQFVDQAAHDYHLKSSSPAIDAAMPSTGLFSPIDFDGTSRPQGDQIDIGAFEFRP